MAHENHPISQKTRTCVSYAGGIGKEDIGKEDILVADAEERLVRNPRSETRCEGGSTAEKR